MGAAVEWRTDPAAVRRWMSGSTGLPFIDACMRELGGSGYMSNRGRQNVAGLFCKVCGALGHTEGVISGVSSSLLGLST